MQQRLFLRSLLCDVLGAGHQPGDMLAGQVTANVLGGRSRTGQHGPRHDAGTVRRAEHVRQFEEWVVGSEWRVPGRLIPPGVDPGTKPWVRPQVLVQRFLIDNGSPGHVHQDRVWLHEGEFAYADQATGGQGERQADDEDIGSGQHMVQVGERGHELGRLAGQAGAAHGMDARAERLHQPSRRDADSAEAEYGADRVVQDLRRRPLVEPAGGHGGVPLDQALSQAQRHREHILRHRSRVCASIAGHQQVSGQRLEVDRVDACREQLEELRARCGREHAGRNLFGHFPRDHSIGTANGLSALFVVQCEGADDRRVVSEDLRVDPGVVIVCRVAHRYQPFPGHRAVVQSREVHGRSIIRRMPGLLESLARGPVVCAEGYLFECEKRGYLQAGAFVPEVVLDHPDVVEELHREFVHAGSGVVEAFTYYGHREKLRVLGKEAILEPLNTQALSIAARVARETGTLLAGNLCNTNVYEPGSPDLPEVRAAFEEQVAWAAEAGADMIIAETFSWLGEALLALEVIRSSGLPAVVTFAVHRDGTLRDVDRPEEACRQAEQAGASVVGLN